METQMKHIKKHLLKFGSIASWDAIRFYKITRLSQYIYILKKQGYKIEYKDLVNNKKRFRVYFLVDEGEAYEQVQGEKN